MIARFGAILLAATAIAGALRAQTTRLTVGGYNGNLGNTVVADLEQGYRESGNDMTYTVRIVGNPPTDRITSVSVRANSAVLGGTKPVSHVLYRRDDLPDVPASWVPMSTTDTLLETRLLTSATTPWSNGIWFRILLSWLDDPNTTYSVDLTFTLQVTAP